MITVLSLGAGVQSSALALMAAHGEIEPMPDCAIFADVQAEPQEVYDWLDWLIQKLPYPVHIVTKGDLKKEASDLRVSKKSGKRYLRTRVPYFTLSPETTETVSHEIAGQVDAWGDTIKTITHPPSKGMLARICTTDFKIVPVHKKMRELLKESGDSRVEQWFGISIDEIQRMREPRHNWMDYRYPLIEHKISRDDCIRWMKVNGYPEPPRSACYFCPYHSDDEWLRLKHDHPAEFDLAVKHEKTAQEHASQCDVLRGVPYLHRSCVPLDRVDFKSAKKDPRQLSFLDECEGMCGV